MAMNASSRGWLLPAGLIGLAVVPLAAGSMRLVELAGDVTITADNARFHAAPWPVVVHIASAALFCVMGAFQFASRQVQRHRKAGLVALPAGLLVALTGLWMTLAYPWPPGDGASLHALRLLFGIAMVISIAMALRALSMRDFAAHGDWMTRAYAIGMGAGTQVLTHASYFIVAGRPDEDSRAVLMGAGWVINVVVAEALVARRRKPAAGGLPAQQA
jgi:hypothetical protein